MAKLYDSRDPAYKSPFGAIRQGEQCTFTIRLPRDMQLEGRPVMVLFRSGFKERFITLNTITGEGDVTAYSAVFSAKYTGVHYYYFSYIAQGQRVYIKRSGTGEGVLDKGELFQLTVFGRDFETPGWLKGGVMYQIFPDRFCKSGMPHENVPEDRVLRQDWGGTPCYKPDRNGHVWNNDYFGGDLEGIRRKLPYLQELGVTCLYLNPIFEAHENHRYNTADYRKVDPLLGTNEDFAALCRDAEARGIRVLLDGVFSHTGADSVYFNKFNRYDSCGACQSQDSPYFPWYSFIRYPEEYESWWGIDTLPNVQENEPSYTEFICGDEGVLRYWLDQGAAGFRLDVADELPDQFIENLRRCVKGADPDKLVIGEVWEDATTKESYGRQRRYLLGDQLDGVMNYPFRAAILDYAAGGSPWELKNRILTLLENYPKPAVDVLMNFLSTHDVPRAINCLGGESCAHHDRDWMARHRLTPEEYALGRARLRTALVLLFFLPGIPCIYYGDEAGMQGDKDPFNRGCYPWGQEDRELMDFTRELSRIRRSSPVFREGELAFLCLEEQLLVFARYDRREKQTVVIGLNRSDQLQYMKLEPDMCSPEYLRGRAPEPGSDLIPVPPHDCTVIRIPDWIVPEYGQ